MILLFQGGCESAGQKGLPPAGRYVVSAAKTLFYHYGPAQASGPDLQLSKGQRVTVVKREFGYSRVVLDDGQSGYVATEDIAPAPPEAAPSPTPKSRRERPEPMSPRLPRGDFDKPLPLPETPKPSFRF